MSSPPPILDNRVRFAETDQQGVVFYGTFFTYQDEAFNEYCRRIEYPYERMREAGWTTHVVDAHLSYRAPAGFGDVVENGLRIDSIGESSLVAEYAARRAEDGTLLAEGSVTHVTADVETGEAIPVPADFRAAIRSFQDVPPDEE